MAASATLARSAKRGEAPEPVVLGGHKIAATFWGQGWCRNLESYSDFSNRLPRGRSYLRAGAVIDLKIAAGKVRARVAGSRVYEVEISVRALPPETWRSVVSGCGGQIGSMVTLLEGRIPDEVMRVVTDPEQGLFPKPRQIAMTCSCPDWAGMCKHVAASLYAVGARLDSRPELLFILRGVDPTDLVHAAAGEMSGHDVSGASAFSTEDLGEMFGIELATPAPRAASPRASDAKRRTTTDAVAVARPKVKARPAREQMAKPRKRRKPSPRAGVGLRRRAAPSPVDEFLGQLAQLGRFLRRSSKQSKRP